MPAPGARSRRSAPATRRCARNFKGLKRHRPNWKAKTSGSAGNLEAALQNARALEDDKAKLSSEIAAARVAMATLMKQLGEEASNVRVLSDEKRLLTERADTSDQRIVGLEAEVAHARERLSLVENDKDTLQAALDRKLAESSRLSRQLAESESALSDSRSRLRQIESSLAAAESERNKLAAACDEANERRQSEVYALELKLDALRSHSDAAERWRPACGRTWSTRTEEIESAEAKLSEATIARSEAEKKLEHLAAVGEGWEQHAQNSNRTSWN